MSHSKPRVRPACSSLYIHEPISFRPIGVKTLELHWSETAKEKQYSGFSEEGRVISCHILVSTVEHLETVFKQSAEQTFYFCAWTGAAQEWSCVCWKTVSTVTIWFTLQVPVTTCLIIPYSCSSISDFIFILKDSNRHFASERKTVKFWNSHISKAKQTNKQMNERWNKHTNKWKTTPLSPNTPLRDKQ